MEVFEDAALRKFEDDMVSHLKLSCAEQAATLTNKDLSAFIREGTSNAEKYGITDEVDVRRFLEFVLRHDSDFELETKALWASGILRDTQLSGMEKMNQIEEEELLVKRPASP